MDQSLVEVEESGVMALPLLQSNIKKDPEGYRSDFLNQYANLRADLDIFASGSGGQTLNKNLLMFAAQTAHFYGKADELASRIRQLLDQFFESSSVKQGHLHILLGALMLMDSKGHLQRDELYQSLIDFMGRDNDEIAKVIVKHLVRVFNSTKKSEETRAWQMSIFKKFEISSKHDRNQLVSKRLIFIMVSLYLKGRWKGTQTANAIAQGVYCPTSSVAEIAARFILGDAKRLHISAVDSGEPEDLDEDEQKKKQAELVSTISKELSFGTNARKAKSKKRLERLKEQAEKEIQKMEQQTDKHVALTFEIMDRIHDPHAMAEQLYQAFSKKNCKHPFRVKLLLYTVAARLMGKYCVSIPGFFHFFIAHIKPGHRQITRLLAVVAQAVHEHVPPQELQPLSRHIADQFVTESSPPPVCTVGLNAIRIMCSRNHEAITSDLLSDLVRYNRDSNNPTIKRAAASLRNLYRVRCPEWLPKKERGRRAGLLAVMDSELAGYATTDSSNLLGGLEILVKLKELQNRRKRKRGQQLAAEDMNIDEAIRKLQTETIMEPEDFAALKKIRIKMATAAAMGLSLSHWLDKEGAWEEMAQSVLGSTKRRRLDDETADPIQTPVSSGDIEGIEDSQSEEDSESDETEQIEKVPGDDDFDYIMDQIEHGDRKTKFSDGENSIDEGGSQADESGSTADSDADDESEEETDDEYKEEVITGDYLAGGHVKPNRKQAQQLARQNKAEKHREKKEAAREGHQRARAGITNRVSARNKPMAMVRMKLQVKEKRKVSARAKLQSLQSHVKTLQKQKRQKLRRR